MLRSAGLAVLGILLALPARAAAVPKFDSEANFANQDRIVEQAPADPTGRNERSQFKEKVLVNKSSNAEMRSCAKDATLHIGQDHRLLYLYARGTSCSA